MVSKKEGQVVLFYFLYTKVPVSFPQYKNSRKIHVLIHSVIGDAHIHAALQPLTNV